MLSITHNPSANSTLNNSIKITVHMYFYFNVVPCSVACLCVYVSTFISEHAGSVCGCKEAKNKPRSSPAWLPDPSHIVPNYCYTGADKVHLRCQRLWMNECEASMYDVSQPSVHAGVSTSISPRSPCSRTCWHSCLGSFSLASSGLTGTSPESPVSSCAPSGTS